MPNNERTLRGMMELQARWAQAEAQAEMAADEKQRALLRLSRQRLLADGVRHAAGRAVSKYEALLAIAGV